MMDFFEIAMEMEEKTVANYQKLSERCTSNKGIRTILTMLARDHEKHVQTLKGMKDKSCAVMGTTEAFSKARRLFEDMQKGKETFSCDLDQIQLYLQVRDMVLKKMRFYDEMKDEADCAGDRLILEKIADEERRQSIVLDNIIEMVNRPNMWLEDAEFNHLDEY